MLTQNTNLLSSAFGLIAFGGLCICGMMPLEGRGEATVTLTPADPRFAHVWLHKVHDGYVEILVLLEKTPRPMHVYLTAINKRELLLETIMAQSLERRDQLTRFSLYNIENGGVAPPEMALIKSPDSAVYRIDLDESLVGKAKITIRERPKGDPVHLQYQILLSDYFNSAKPD